MLFFYLSLMLSQRFTYFDCNILFSFYNIKSIIHHSLNLTIVSFFFFFSISSRRFTRLLAVSLSSHVLLSTLSGLSWSCFFSFLFYIVIPKFSYLILSCSMFTLIPFPYTLFSFSRHKKVNKCLPVCKASHATVNLSGHHTALQVIGESS